MGAPVRRRRFPKVKIVLILCLTAVLNGCFGLGALTFESVEHETESFSIANEKNAFDPDDSPARLTKEQLISTWGEPDEVSKEGKCEVVTYYDGYVWTGAYVQLAFFPIPLLAPTGHHENRFYFVDGESVELITRRGRITKCLGGWGVLPRGPNVDCRKINMKAPKLHSDHIDWCDENLELSWEERENARAAYQLYYRGATRIERLEGLCRSADSGYAFAQAEVGRLYRWGLQGVQQDLAKAYLWYAQANRQNPALWQDELNEVRRQAASVEKLPWSEVGTTGGRTIQCEGDLVPKNAWNRSEAYYRTESSGRAGEH